MNPDVINNPVFPADIFSQSSGEGIDSSRLSIDKQHLLKLIGYGEQDKDPYIDGMMASFLQECLQICHPEGTYRIYGKVEADQKNKMITLPGLSFHTDAIVTRQLKHSGFLAIFAVTAGIEIEQYASRLLNAQQYLEGLIVNSIGSLVADAAAEFIHNRIEQVAAGAGMKITNRFSPGYCNWNVHEQHKLFSLLPPEACHISLNENALMTPIKSATGIIGIGRHVEKQEYPCTFCPRNDCMMRRES